MRQLKTNRQIELELCFETFPLKYDKIFVNMKFYGIDHQIVELIVDNCQFPEIEDCEWDSNWLNLFIKVDSKFGKWQTFDPSLTTWEFQEIIDWFEELSKNQKPKFSKLTFTEPNLAFELLNQPTDIKKSIRICFNLELRPKSASDNAKYFVDILVDNDAINEIIKGLKDEIIDYPERKPNA